MSWDDERVVCGGDEVKHSVRYWEKGPPFRAVTGITCVLSMIGAVLIIVSYVFYKNLRNRARLILVHLSLMDFGVALSNLIGNLIHFDRYYITYNATCMIYHWPPHHYTEYLCEAQAFFAHFFTLGSILWTISLAVYLYFLLMHSRTSLAPISLTISYFTCYAVPLFICLWLLFTHKFGYSSKSFGWCTLLVFSDMTHQSNVFGAVIGYDLWVYLAMTFVIALYLAVQLFLREKLKQSKKYLRDGEERFREALTILDYRFFLIPLMFALLRMWTCMVFIFQVYTKVQGIPLPIKIIMGYLSSIGDSAQGFVNAILFVIFTKTVRNTVFNVRFWKRKIQSSSNQDSEEARLLNGGPTKAASDVQSALKQPLQGRGQRLTGTSEIFTPITASQSYPPMN